MARAAADGPAEARATADPPRTGSGAAARTAPGSFPTIAGAARALRVGETTSVALVSAALTRADALDERIGAYVARFDAAALAAAARADAELVAGVDRGPLHGIPIGVKDIFATVEGPTTAASRAVDPAWSDGFDAAVVERLRAAGAVVPGKLTTMELAIGLTDRDGPFPTPRNPWDLDAWPGGSSSGAGVAIAAGLLPGAIGTDTGGSIRMPAAFCGVTGLMPTYGRVSSFGCLPLAPSMDHVGPLARTAQDCGLLLAALAGHDPRDPASAERPPEDPLARLRRTTTGEADPLARLRRTTTGEAGPLARLGRPLDGVRIGAARADHFGHADDDPAARPVFEAALEQLAQLGADVVEVALPDHAATLQAHLVTMLFEARAQHRDALDARRGEFAAGTLALLDLGQTMTGADHARAQSVRAATQRALDAMLRDVDAIATPTITAGAPLLEDLWAHGVASRAATIHTPYWDAIANPVLSVPSGFTAAGLPLALQLAARPFEEALLVQLGDAYQRATDWHLRTPPLA